MSRLKFHYFGTSYKSARLAAEFLDTPNKLIEKLCVDHKSLDLSDLGIDSPPPHPYHFKIPGKRKLRSSIEWRGKHENNPQIRNFQPEFWTPYDNFRMPRLIFKHIIEMCVDTAASRYSRPNPVMSDLRFKHTALDNPINSSIFLFDTTDVGAKARARDKGTSRLDGKTHELVELEAEIYRALLGAFPVARVNVVMDYLWGYSSTLLFEFGKEIDSHAVVVSFAETRADGESTYDARQYDVFKPSKTVISDLTNYLIKITGLKVADEERAKIAKSSNVYGIYGRLSDLFNHVPKNDIIREIHDHMEVNGY